MAQRTSLSVRTAFRSFKGMVLTFSRSGTVTHRLVQVDTHLAIP
jgi:hypothetical protein